MSPSPCWKAALLCCLWMLSAVAGAGQEPDAALDASTAAEIERLRLEIAALLASVPPSLRDRVRQALLAEDNSADAIAEMTAGSLQPTGQTLAGPNSGQGDGAPPTGPSHEEPSPSPAAPADRAAITVQPSRPRVSATPTAQTAPRVRNSSRPECNSLDVFDENGDAKVNAQDRYWRHLFLWVDGNRDGQVQDKEIESAYGAGVREISTRLDVFFRKKGSLGEIRVGRSLLLDLGGDGFGDERRPNDGVLMVDTDALGRGDGPEILTGAGEKATGFAAFAAGWTFRLADGSELVVSCPRQVGS